MTCADLTVDIVPIVRAIAGKGRHRALDLLQQGTDLRAVIDILAGQLGGDDPARVGVGGKMQLAPPRTPFAAIELHSVCPDTDLSNRGPI